MKVIFRKYKCTKAATLVRSCVPGHSYHKISSSNIYGDYVFFSVFVCRQERLLWRVKPVKNILLPPLFSIMLDLHLNSADHVTLCVTNSTANVKSHDTFAKIPLNRYLWKSTWWECKNFPEVFQFFFFFLRNVGVSISSFQLRWDVAQF